MKNVWLLPNGCFDTAEKQEKSLHRRCHDLTFEDAIAQNEIARCIADGDKNGQKRYSFTALFKMVAYGVTGLYPHLEEYRQELEERIEEYISLLTK